MIKMLQYKMYPAGELAVLRQLLLKNKIVSLFPIVKMKPNHAEICRVGNLELNFQQVSLIQSF